MRIFQFNNFAFECQCFSFLGKKSHMFIYIGPFHSSSGEKCINKRGNIFGITIELTVTRVLKTRVIFFFWFFKEKMKVNILVSLSLLIIVLILNSDSKPTPSPQFPFTVLTSRKPRPSRPGPEINCEFPFIKS